jgi:hypothetical protein
MQLSLAQLGDGGDAFLARLTIKILPAHPEHNS